MSRTSLDLSQTLQTIGRVISDDGAKGVYFDTYLGEGKKAVQQLHGSDKHLLAYLMERGKVMQP